MAEEAADLAEFDGSSAVGVGEALERTHAEHLEVCLVEQPARDRQVEWDDAARARGETGARRKDQCELRAPAVDACNERAIDAQRATQRFDASLPVRPPQQVDYYNLRAEESIVSWLEAARTKARRMRQSSPANRARQFGEPHRSRVSDRGLRL